MLYGSWHRGWRLLTIILPSCMFVTLSDSSTFSQDLNSYGSPDGGSANQRSMADVPILCFGTYPHLDFFETGSQPFVDLFDGRVVDFAFQDTKDEELWFLHAWCSDGILRTAVWPAVLDSTTQYSRWSETEFQVPDGVSYSEIAGISIDPETGVVYSWYLSGKVAAGDTHRLDSQHSRVNFVIPHPRGPADIAGIDISPDDGRVYTWFTDGFFSIGTPYDLASHQAPQPYGIDDARRCQRVFDIAFTHDNSIVCTFLNRPRFMEHSPSTTSSEQDIDNEFGVRLFDYGSWELTIDEVLAPLKIVKRTSYSDWHYSADVKWNDRLGQIEVRGDGQRDSRSDLKIVIQFRKKQPWVVCSGAPTNSPNMAWGDVKHVKESSSYSKNTDTKEKSVEAAGEWSARRVDQAANVSASSNPEQSLAPKLVLHVDSPLDRVEGEIVWFGVEAIGPDGVDEVRLKIDGAIVRTWTRSEMREYDDPFRVRCGAELELTEYGNKQLVAEAELTDGSLLSESMTLFVANRTSQPVIEIDVIDRLTDAGIQKVLVASARHVSGISTLECRTSTGGVFARARDAESRCMMVLGPFPVGTKEVVGWRAVAGDGQIGDLSTSLTW